MSGSAAIKAEGGVGDSWSTPFPLWEEIWHRYYPKGVGIFDPCPNRDRILPGTWAKEIWTDGLSLNWTPYWFGNVPWSDITPWADHAIQQMGFGIMLVPNRSDQRWFQAVGPFVKLVNIGGRVNYINPETGTTQVFETVKDPVTGKSVRTGKLKPGAISCPSSLLIFGSDKPGTVEYWTPECHKGRKTKAAPLAQALAL